VVTRQYSPSLSPLPFETSASFSTRSPLSSEACHTPLVLSRTSIVERPWNTSVALYEENQHRSPVLPPSSAHDRYERST
jgi:hypothetical protein